MIIYYVEGDGMGTFGYSMLVVALALGMIVTFAINIF